MVAFSVFVKVFLYLLTGSRISCRTDQQDEGGWGSWWGPYWPPASTWRSANNTDTHSKYSQLTILTDKQKNQHTANLTEMLCVCVRSCESPSCGWRDVASCCCCGSCNTWFVTSVMTNMREKLIEHDFPISSSCLLCFSSRCPAGCFGSAAADYCEPAGYHHGNPLLWICLSVYLFWM